MGQFDTLMKLLVDAIPETIAQFSLYEWQKYEHLDPKKVQITNVAQLSTDFKSEEPLAGDNVLLVEGPEGPLYLIEVEFQSKLDTSMPLRSLEYLIRAKKKHRKKYGQLPVVAVVIYLFHGEDNKMPVSPMHWPAPYERTTMDFHYVSIPLKDLSRSELLAFDEPLWPLALLTKEPVDRILIQHMLTELVEKKLYKLLPICQTLAARRLHGKDLVWFNEEYQKMSDIIKDSPAYQWMREDILQELIPEFEQKRLEDLKQAEKRLLEEQKQKEKKTLTTWRQTVVELVSKRFPTLQRLVKAQVHLLKEPELFQLLILRLSLAYDADEAQEVLLALSEKDEDE